MVDVEGVGRVGVAVWVDESERLWEEHRWDTLPVLGMIGDDCYLIEIDDANRERMLLDIVDNFGVEDRGLRIEMAFFGDEAGFFASPMAFLQHWPKSAAEVPADVFVDERHKGTFTREGDDIVVSVRHALRPSGGPPRRRLRFAPGRYEAAMVHLAQESRRLRDDLLAAAQQRAPEKVGALQEAFERWARGGQG